MKGIQDNHYNMFLDYVIGEYEMFKQVDEENEKRGLKDPIKSRLKYLESIIKLYKPEYFEPANKQS